MPVAEGSRCARHTEAPAIELCARCGAFICPACLEFRDTEVLCTDCHARLMGPASTQAVLSLVLSVLGLSCVPFLPGVVGLVLAMNELDAIEQGLAPESGKSIALGGKYLGLINTALLVVSVGAVAIAFIVARR